MRAVTSPAELSRVCRADTLCLWAAGELTHARAWRTECGDVVAVLAPNIFGRRRIALWAHEGTAAAPLLDEVLDEVLDTCLDAPPTRLLGPAAVVEACPSLRTVGEPFGWMDCRQTTPPPTTLPQTAPPHRAGWLDAGMSGEVTELLDEAFPDSRARPGVAGVGRWAGVRLRGRLAAVGAMAWSAPAVGFLAGFATRPEYRGRGLAGGVCRFLADRALAEHPAVALVVHRDNTAARRTYARIGFTHRLLAGADLRDRPAVLEPTVDER